MSTPYLGVGWRFPIEFEQGRAALAVEEESVHQSIWIILGTAPGERVMRPEFGCGIHNLVLALNNATTAGLAAFEVRQALLRWEPRIELLDVRVTAEDERLLVNVEYAVRATNSRFNLVYPFHLERGTV